MTQAKFKNLMNVYSGARFEDTCCKLQAEIVRKIVNNKVMTDPEKMAMLKQYMSNLATNETIVEGVKMYNTR